MKSEVLFVCVGASDLLLVGIGDLLRVLMSMHRIKRMSIPYPLFANNRISAFGSKMDFQPFLPDESFQAEEAPAAETPKRPPNAFILFCLERRQEVKGINPALANTEISRSLGDIWKDLPEQSKKPYKEKARQLQAEFKAKFPNYKYAKSRKRRQQLLGEQQFDLGMIKDDRIFTVNDYMRAVQQQSQLFSNPNSYPVML